MRESSAARGGHEARPSCTAAAPGLVALLLGVLATGAAMASDLRVERVTDHAYAIVGPKQQRSAANLANNATFGFVLTGDGVLLVDPGGSWRGAQALHAAIRGVTQMPVKVVVNTGGQDHRWLGNGYWKAQGARIIASRAAVEDQQARASTQLAMLAALLGDELDGTEPVYADQTFESRQTLTLGGADFELVHTGAAHTPGDSFVWMAAERVLFSGDIVYVERILGIGEQSSSAGWLEAFEALATHEPARIVPGHGAATDLATARAQTRAYLVNLRARMREHIDAGGDILGAVDVDQSAFAHLEQYDALARRNAQAVFIEMEFE